MFFFVFVGARRLCCFHILLGTHCFPGFSPFLLLCNSVVDDVVDVVPHERRVDIAVSNLGDPEVVFDTEQALYHSFWCE